MKKKYTPRAGDLVMYIPKGSLSLIVDEIPDIGFLVLQQVDSHIVFHRSVKDISDAHWWKLVSRPPEESKPQ